MKTMTCRQMGGPCDMPIHGNTADEMIKAGDSHLHEMAMQGDMEHKKMAEMMDNMKKNPQSGTEWYENFKKQFASQPED